MPGHTSFMLLVGGFFLLGVRIEELIQFTVLYRKYWVSYNIYKVPSTLKVYVAAISAHHAPIDGSSLRSHNFVGSFLKGARNWKPFVLLLCGTCTLIPLCTTIWTIGCPCDCPWKWRFFWLLLPLNMSVSFMPCQLVSHACAGYRSIQGSFFEIIRPFFPRSYYHNLWVH